MPAPGNALGRAACCSPYLNNALERCADIAALLQSGNLDAALAAAKTAGTNETDIGVALRREKLALSLVLAVGDLAGLFSLETVMRELSDFADRALDAALADAIMRRTPDAPVQGFAMIALGKHGSRELNYSSDIDPIFLYDPETLPRRSREEPGEAAQRIARAVIDTLSRRDGNGYVFRVDMQLRPASEVSPLAIPVEAAISHYESSALTWEQAAFIRSRAAAGDVALGRYFLQQIRPFIWRRSLDFGTIAEIGKLTARIRDHYGDGQRFGPGYDLKRGQGGIREVEFFAQTQQLVHGGRNPELRSGATCDALAALAEAGLADRDEAARLTEHYRLLRTIEHRLQMVDDAQTHVLSSDTNALDNVAALHGLADGAALLDVLRPATDEVAAIYGSLIRSYQSEASAAELSENADTLAVQLHEMGFAATDDLASRIEKWRGGQARSIRSEPARQAFEAVLPSLMQALARAPDPDRAINRLDDLIRRLPSAINFFRLLEARPALLQLLADVLSHAPVLADALAVRSDLFDGLIDASALDPLDSITRLAAGFAQVESGDDYQRVLDRVRLRVGEKRFALGVQLIEARADPLAIAQGYAHVAEAAIDVLARATIAEFERVHGRIDGCDLVILALGRMGGEALTHASDLDLIFLFAGDLGAESDGGRPLGTTQYFNRLTQRVIAALSVPTASGTLYEVDTRLRPSGAQGLLSVNIASFWEYQREKAWTWEHMALCRARPVFGPEPVKTALAADIRNFLAESRDASTIIADARKMRGDMAAHKPPKGAFDAKLLPGGLVDLEFIVHVMQLTSGQGLSPRLHEAVAQLADAGLVDSALIDAQALLTRLLVVLRLVSPDCDAPPLASQMLMARACGCDDWDALLAAFAKARQSVRDEWERVFGDAQYSFAGATIT